MRRVLVLVSLCAGLGALGIIACGGDPKPPLTPDDVPHEETLEAGSSPGSPTTTSPAK